MKSDPSAPTAVISAQVARLRALLEVNAAIATVLDRPALFRVVVETLRRIMSCETAGFGAWDPSTQELRLVAAVGLLEQIMPVGGPIPCERIGGGPPYDFTEAIVRSDLDQAMTFEFERMSVALGRPSICVVPVHHRGVPLGALAVGTQVQAAYDGDDVDFLREVGALMGLALTNIDAFSARATARERAVAAARRHRLLLEVTNATVSERTAEGLVHALAKVLAKACRFEAIGVSERNPSDGVYRMIGVAGDVAVVQRGTVVDRRDSTTGDLLDLSVPVVIADMSAQPGIPLNDVLASVGYRSICVVPLRVGDEVVGTLAVSSRAVDQYDDADVELLSEVAGQVAVAVKNFMALEALRDLEQEAAALAEHRRTLLQVTNALLATDTREELLDALGPLLATMIPYDLLAFLEHDMATRRVRIVGMWPAPPPGVEVGTWLPMSDANRDRPIVIDDLTRAPLSALQQTGVDNGHRSYLAVPLAWRGETIGALGFTSCAIGQYTLADADRLQEVADQVALAYANFRAYDEIATLKTRLEAENLYLQEEIRSEHDFREVVGSSPALLATLAIAERVAATDSTVLIVGETGTGKELVARAVHDHSARRGRPLVKVNCGAISAGLVESELFGHVRGAFTGAVTDRKGRFAVADGGTLFLDEVGELPLDTQVKLLRVLQEREFEPVGGTTTHRVDVRIIAATNRDLAAEVERGRFRADLYYRLNVVPIELPPLRQRTGDIATLATFFVQKHARRLGRTISAIDVESLRQLEAYPWPGNVRELENVIERAVVLSLGDRLFLPEGVLAAGPITPRPGAAVAPAPSRPAPSPRSLQPPRSSDDASRTLESITREHMLAALRAAHWVIEGDHGAARALGLHPNTLRSRLKRLGIRRGD